MHEGRFSLIRLFTSFAMIGAEWVMWVLVALSIVSVGIMLERWRYYHSLRDDLEKLAEDLRNLLRRNDVDGAKKRLGSSPSPAASIALAGLNEADRGADSADEAMAAATSRVKMPLERNLAFLGTVGNNAPFIGLFGTVIGIIQAFDALKANQNTAATAARGAADAASAVASAQQTLGATGRVMGTIAEALVATAIGLLVAIPAVAAFNYFQRRVRGIVGSVDSVTHVVLAHLRGVAVTASGPSRASAAAEPAATAAPKSSSKSARSEAKPSKDESKNAKADGDSESKSESSSKSENE